MSIKSISSTLKEEKQQQNDNHNINNNDNTSAGNVTIEHKNKRTASMMSKNENNRTVNNKAINNKKFKSSQNNKNIETSLQTHKKEKGLLSTALNQLRESSKSTHVDVNDVDSHNGTTSSNHNKQKLSEISKNQIVSKIALNNTKVSSKSTANATASSTPQVAMDPNNPYTNQRTIYIEG